MKKKEFSSFDIAVATKELQSTITDSRVNNIYQFGEKTFVFKLHKTDKPPIRLIVEAGRRIHSTAYSEESPLEPPAFCMLLRKYLRDSWLANIEQVEFERIVIVSFRTKTGLLKLVVELFGDGNIILTNEENVIIQALTFKRMRDRDILRKVVLTFPPSTGKNPFKVGLTDIEKALLESGDNEVVRMLARFLGIGGVYAEEILLRANMEKNKACKDLSSSDAEQIFIELGKILALVSDGKFNPCIVKDKEDNYIEVLPFKLERYKEYNTQPYSTFNEAADEFFLQITAVEKAADNIKVDKLRKETERLKRIVTEQENSISEEENKAEKYRQIGDMIYAHFNELQNFQNKIMKANQAGKDWKIIIAEVFAAKKAGEIPASYIESFDGKKLALNLCIDGLHFALILRKSLFENANEQYERGKKAKEKAAGALAALQKSKRKLKDTENQLQEAENLKNLKPAEIVETLSKRKEAMENKQWYEKFRWFISSDGFLVVAGKDTVSNEVLIKKYTTQEDIVFHAEITGAPFVVVKAEGKPVSEQALSEAGEFAAAYSRAWRENAGSADVYWVKVDQLSKSGPSGESVPHGAFFVVGKRNWLRKTPLRVSVGIILNEEAKFVGGAVDAVKAKTKIYVVILPGDYQGKELLKQVMRSLVVKLSKEQRERIGKTSIEQIREFIPYTKGVVDKKVT